MKERPILMSAPMVRACLNGSKTQTRRVVKAPAKNMQASGMEVITHRAPGERWYKDHVWSMRNEMGVWGDYTHEQFMALCPYGKPGDLLWVREAWQQGDSRERPIVYRATDEHSVPPLRWRPSIFMRRADSRLTLRITEVRVERLQGISEADARAEGVHPLMVDSGGVTPWGQGIDVPDYTSAYAELWESINGKGSWDANPLVWVIVFEKVAA